MKLKLLRRESSENCTLGQLFIDDEPQCFTCEDVVREQPHVEIKQWKIPGETAIPRGTYEVVITHSERFKRELPLLVDVPSFSGVRIHPGNTAEDTEGCILVGEYIGNESVTNSRKAFNELFIQLQAAIANGEKIHMEIL